MNTMQLLFSPRGRIGRLTYGCVAIPILAILHFQGWIAHWLVMALGFDSLTTYPIASIIVIVGLSLLVLPLMAVSAKRLHDLGLSGFLALPYLIGALLPFLSGAIAMASPPSSSPPSLLLRTAEFDLMSAVAIGIWIYGLALAAVLLLSPTRQSNGGEQPV